MLSHNDRGVYALIAWIVNTITQNIGGSVVPSSVPGTLTNKKRQAAEAGLVLFLVKSGLKSRIVGFHNDSLCIFQCEYFS